MATLYSIIDDNGLFINSIWLEEAPADLHTTVPLTINFIKPQFDGEQWIEGATAPEIDERNAAKIAELKIECYKELNVTDWVWIRKNETGQEPPEAILQERAAIRANYDAQIAALNSEAAQLKLSTKK